MFSQFFFQIYFNYTKNLFFLYEQNMFLFFFLLWVQKKVNNKCKNTIFTWELPECGTMTPALLKLFSQRRMDGRECNSSASEKPPSQRVLFRLKRVNESDSCLREKSVFLSESSETNLFFLTRQAALHFCLATQTLLNLIKVWAIGTYTPHSMLMRYFSPVIQWLYVMREVRPLRLHESNKPTH